MTFSKLATLAALLSVALSAPAPWHCGPGQCQGVGAAPVPDWKRMCTPTGAAGTCNLGAFMTPSNNVAHTSPGNVDFYVYDNACNKIGIYLNAGHDSKDMAAIDSTLKWTVDISKYTAPNYWGQGAELQLKYSTQTVKMSKGGCDCTAQVTDQGTWQSCSCAFKCP